MCLGQVASEKGQGSRPRPHRVHPVLLIRKPGQRAGQKKKEKKK